MSEDLWNACGHGSCLSLQLVHSRTCMPGYLRMHWPAKPGAWGPGAGKELGLFRTLPLRSIPLMRKAGLSASLSLLKHNSTSPNKHSGLLSHLPSLFLCFLISCGHLYPHHRSGMGLLIHIYPFALQYWETGHQRKSQTCAKIFPFGSFWAAHCTWSKAE